MDVSPLVNRALLARTGRASRVRSGGLRLFDEVEVQHRLVARFLADEPLPLVAAVVSPSPGVYGLRYHATHPEYPELDSHRFVYVGKGAYLPERISSHVASLSQTTDLAVTDFSMVAVALDSVMHAEVAECLLAGAFDPLWCRPGWRGFGSRPQGAGRRRQRATDWDQRHPGRLSRTQPAAQGTVNSPGWCGFA